MKQRESKWADEILKRFPRREDMGKDGLYEGYFRGELHKEDVLDCLNLLEFEFKIQAGFLRPEDKLDDLFKPIGTKNPLRWLVYQTRAGDRQSEVSYQLSKRLRQHGTYDAWTKIETIDDLIRAWCGKNPR